METRPGEVVLLTEEARLLRVAVRYALNASELLAGLAKRQPALLKGIEPLDLKTKMVLRLVEDRLPEPLEVVE